MLVLAVPSRPSEDGVLGEQIAIGRGTAGHGQHALGHDRCLRQRVDGVDAFELDKKN